MTILKVAVIRSVPIGVAVGEWEKGGFLSKRTRSRHCSSGGEGERDGLILTTYKGLVKGRGRGSTQRCDPSAL